MIISSQHVHAGTGGYQAFRPEIRNDSFIQSSSTILGELIHGNQELAPTVWLCVAPCKRR